MGFEEIYAHDGYCFVHSRYEWHQLVSISFAKYCEICFYDEQLSLFFAIATSLFKQRFLEFMPCQAVIDRGFMSRKLDSAFGTSTQSLTNDEVYFS